MRERRRTAFPRSGLHVAADSDAHRLSDDDGVVPVARRNLLAEKGRLAMSVAGVACAVVLILLVVSLYRGWSGAARILDELPGDVWVAQQGTRDPFRSTSLLPPGREAALAAVDGVQVAVPVLARRVAFDRDDRSLDVFFMALDAPARESWPAEIRDRFLPAPGEVVIDEVLAREAGVGEGDVLEVEGTALRVAAVRPGGNPLFQLAFLKAGDAREVLGLRETVSFYLLALDDGADPEAVMRKVALVVPGSEPSTSRAFADATARLVDEGFLPVVGTLVAIGFLIGGAVIALTTYTATIEKAQDFGVLKALGASGGFVYRIVVEQSLIVGSAGALLGVGIATFAAGWIEDRVPEFVTDLRPLDAVGVLVAAIAVSIVAAWVPARRIDRIDPAVVFRA
jgi:putative ABC transport system permease protein